MGDSAKNNNVVQDVFSVRKKTLLSMRSDVEKIILHLQGKLPNSELSPELEDKLRKLKIVSELISKYGSAQKTIPLIQERFELSYSGARKLFVQAQDAYGEMTHFNKKFHVDTYIGMLVKAANLAMDEGQFKAFASLMKEYKEAIKEFMSSEEADIYKTLEFPEQIFGVFPEELNIKLPPNYKDIIAKIKQKAIEDLEEANVLTAEHEEDTQ
jgi:hypothetical protein